MRVLWSERGREKGGGEFSVRRGERTCFARVGRRGLTAALHESA